MFGVLENCSVACEVLFDKSSVDVKGVTFATTAVSVDSCVSSTSFLATSASSASFLAASASSASIFAASADF